MKTLNEEQIKTFNDFESYQKTLWTKYYEMHKSMSMLVGTIKQPSEETDALMAAVSSCCSSLEQHWCSLEIKMQNELVIKETGNQLVHIDDNEKKNKAIKSLLNAYGNFSFEAGKLMHFLNTQDDVQTLHRDKNMLKSHIEKVIEIILEQ